MYLAHRAKQMLEESCQHRKMLVHFSNTDITSLSTEVSGSHDIRPQCLSHGGWLAYYLETLSGNEIDS